MKALLNYLEKAEGIDVHYNRVEEEVIVTPFGTETNYSSSEEDITTPYGIYAAVHPEAELVIYIRQVARGLGITVKSRYWSKSELKEINKYLKTKMEKVRALAGMFYRNYLIDAHLSEFPEECQVAMFSMYTNSSTKAWRAVQQSIIDISKSKMIHFSSLSKVDGLYGQKTESALKLIKKEFSLQGYMYFETLMLSNMKTQYIRLAVKNPNKYLVYLKGWDNRMNNLAKMK